MNKSGKTKETTTGNIHLVKEGGNWKLEKESWKSSVFSSDGAAVPDDSAVNSATAPDASAVSNTTASDTSAVNGVTVNGGEVTAKPGNIK